MKFLGVTILQGVEFPIFLLIFAWELQQCSATALPVMYHINNNAFSCVLKVVRLQSDIRNSREVSCFAAVLVQPSYVPTSKPARRRQPQQKYIRGWVLGGTFKIDSLRHFASFLQVKMSESGFDFLSKSP